jgi:hypothetical protein
MINLIDELKREKAHADAMAAAAKIWMRKAHEYQQVIFTLVEAAGGCIEVPRGALEDLPSLELIVDELPEHNCLRYRTRRLAKQSQNSDSSRVRIDPATKA